MLKIIHGYIICIGKKLENLQLSINGTSQINQGTSK